MLEYQKKKMSTVLISICRQRTEDAKMGKWLSQDQLQIIFSSPRKGTRSLHSLANVLNSSAGIPWDPCIHWR
jgi:hypothetical protein